MVMSLSASAGRDHRAPGRRLMRAPCAPPGAGVIEEFRRRMAASCATGAGTGSDSMEGGTDTVPDR